MKVFSYFHDRKTTRYTTYYSVVLTVVIATVIYSTVEEVALGPIQKIATFNEGFFSLYMLSRSEQVEKSFMSHLCKVKAVVKSVPPSA